MSNTRSYVKMDEKVKGMEKLPPNAKILHAEICTLSQSEGFCHASNRYFAGELGLSIQSVSRLLRALKVNGLIYIVHTTDENKYRKRIIKPKSSIVFSKTGNGNAQKRETSTLKNDNHNIVRRIDKNNTSYESRFTPKID